MHSGWPAQNAEARRHALSHHARLLSGHLCERPGSRHDKRRRAMVTVGRTGVAPLKYDLSKNRELDRSVTGRYLIAALALSRAQDAHAHLARRSPWHLSAD